VQQRHLHTLRGSACLGEMGQLSRASDAKEQECVTSI